MTTRHAAFLCCASLLSCSLSSSYVPPSSTGVAARAPGSLAALDAKRGFRDAKLGMAVEELAGLVEPSNEGGLMFYRRESDSLELGRGTLSKVRYGFKNGKLVMITIEASGAGNSEALLESFEAAYGKGSQRNRFLKEYTWLSETVLMTYSRKPGQADSAVVIGDKAFAFGELKAREEKAANADL